MRILFMIALCFNIISAKAQITYNGQLESSYNHFLYHTVMVDPAEGWRGYYLKENDHALNLQTTHGIGFLKNRMRVGIGVGAWYFNSDHLGMSAYSQLDVVPILRRISPIGSIKVGYHHVWNQYVGGTGSSLLDLQAGVLFRFNNSQAMSLKTGYVFIQQSLLWPISLACHF